MNRIKELVNAKIFKAFGHREEEFKQAMLTLNQRAANDDFDLRDVQEAFGQYKVSSEQADTLSLFDGVIAHIEEACEELNNSEYVPVLALQQILKEFKFIIDAPDTFWETLAIQQVKQRVIMMFDQLTAQLDEIIRLKQQDLAIKNEQHQIAKQAQEQRFMEAETAKLQAEKAQIEEARLKLQAEKDLHTAKQEAARKEMERMEAVERFRAAEQERKQREANDSSLRDISQTSSAFDEQIAAWAKKST